MQIHLNLIQKNSQKKWSLFPIKIQNGDFPNHLSDGEGESVEQELVLGSDALLAEPTHQ